MSKSKTDELRRNPYAKLPPGLRWFVRAADPAPGATRICLGSTRVPGEYALMPCSGAMVLRFNSELEARRVLCAYYLDRCEASKAPLALIVDERSED